MTVPRPFKPFGRGQSDPPGHRRRGDQPVTFETRLHAEVEQIAADPPGGVPDGYGLRGLAVHAVYDPASGERWWAAAEYARTDAPSAARRLIGAGPTLADALVALRDRLHDPLGERAMNLRGGWDTQWSPGRRIERSRP